MVYYYLTFQSPSWGTIEKSPPSAYSFDFQWNMPISWGDPLFTCTSSSGMGNVSWSSTSEKLYVYLDVKGDKSYRYVDFKYNLQRINSSGGVVDTSAMSSTDTLLARSSVP